MRFSVKYEDDSDQACRYGQTDEDDDDPTEPVRFTITHIIVIFGGNQVAPVRGQGDFIQLVRTGIQDIVGRAVMGKYLLIIHLDFSNIV